MNDVNTPDHAVEVTPGAAPKPISVKPARWAVLSGMSAAFLAACGGGGGSDTGTASVAGVSNKQSNAASQAPSVAPASSASVPVPVSNSAIVAGAATTLYTSPRTAPEAARFLAQATPGASRGQILALQNMSYADWIDNQLAMPQTQSHYDWLMANGYNQTSNMGQIQGVDNTVWRKFMSSPDSLRQRVSMALAEIFVVGLDGLNQWYPQFSVATYLDRIENSALGNFWNVLRDVTLCPAMGTYLTYMGSQLANPLNGSEPDENYAREIMQLFTIGLYKLNDDGSQVMVNGAPVETYTQADVSGLARVFTGLYVDTSVGGEQAPVTFHLPMKFDPANYEAGEKKYLGFTIPAGPRTADSAMAGLEATMWHLFGHPNVPAFIGKQLIQRLVTSNPSPAYIARVSKAFRDNGKGTRGDMPTVIKAILLDDEARNPNVATTPAFGKLREPMMRFLNWGRAYNATSPNGKWEIGDLSSSALALGQSPAHSPSVFNFFRPGYVPGTSDIAKNGLVAPEFQITNESSVSGYINYMQRAISGQGVGDVRADYSTLTSLANDSSALLDEINLVIAAGQISRPTLITLTIAINTIPVTTAAGKLNRVYAALTLVMASPEYIVQK
jgi:uncharacterized protein (DUF1800 family)